MTSKNVHGGKADYGKKTKHVVLSEEYKYGEGYKKYIVTTQRGKDGERPSVKVMDVSIYEEKPYDVIIQNPISYFSELCEEGMLSSLVPEGNTALSFLEELCQSGLSEKYPNASKEIYTRLVDEIDVIKQKGLVGVFLIIFDLIRFAKTKNIFVSPGRGAIPGCLVAYCLGITGVDPIAENLMFERSLNAECDTIFFSVRIDVEKGSKKLLVDYASDKYGNGMPMLLEMMDILIKEWVELSIIKDTIKNISSSKGKKIDLVEIDKNDPTVFELLLSSDIEGISCFVKDTVLYEAIRPKNMDELMAAITLDRPLPEEYVGKYLCNIKNPQYINYECSELARILSTTYGCVIYQEQVMRILQDIGGFSPEKSDLCRRDLSKRKSSTIGNMREDFVYGAISSKTIGADTANTIFDELWDEARYCFNKSHVAAFSLMIYEMAWLKAYFRLEFMEAVEKYRGMKSDI